MSKYFKTKAGSLEEAVLAAVTPKQIEEGKLPPALQKAIDKKNGKKSDDEDAEEKDGKTMTGKPMSKVEVSVKEKD